MKTLIKIIGVLIALVIALVISLPFIISADYIFNQVSESVEQTTGRTLSIKGEKSLSVFPQLKLSLNDVAFSNIKTGSTPEMASMAQLEVHIPYLAALTGDIKLEKFVIRKPNILLEKMPNGEVNWQLFDGAKQVETKPSPDTQQQSTGLPEGFDVQLGEVAIYEGTFTFIDHQANSKQELTDLDLVIQLPSLTKELNIQGSLNYMNETFDLVTTLTTPKAVIQGDDFELNTELKSRLVNLSFAGSIAKQMSDFSGDLMLSGDSVKDILAWQAQPLTAKKEAFNQFELKANMHFAEQTLKLTALSTALDNLSVTGNATVILDKTPNIIAEFDLGQLNVNPYLPETIEKSVSEQQSETAKSEPIVWDDTPIDLSALGAINADIKVAATGFQFKEIKLGQTALSVKLDKGVAKLGLDKFAAYQGNGNGQVVVNAVSAPYAINTTFALEGIQAEPLLKDAVGFDKLMGAGELNIALNMRGVSQKQFIDSLHGTTGFKFRDGAVKGANIAAMVRSAEKLISGGGFDAKGLEKGFDNAEKTDFSELQGQFTFKNGLSKENDLTLKSPLIRISGKGDINLPQTKLNYRLVTGIVNSIEGQGTEDKSTGFKIPVRLKGPFHDVSIKPDISGAAKDKAKDQLKDKVTDKLKSLFG